LRSAYPLSAQDSGNHAKAATAVTQVFGEGLKLIAVAIEYDAPVKGVALSAGSFLVEGRTVTNVFASTTADPADRADEGTFVIVALAPGDANAALAKKIGGQDSDAGSPRPLSTHARGSQRWRCSPRWN
jgi:predicted peptidase